MNNMKKFLAALVLFGTFFGMSSVAFAGDPNFQLEPVLFEPIQPIESIIPIEPIEPLVPIDPDDPYTDDPALEVFLNGEHLEDGRVALNWERYDGPDFLHYKVVHDQFDSEPYYPEHGFVDYFENQNKTGMVSPEALPVGDNYIRICVITTDDRRGCGNTLYFYQEEMAFEEEPFEPERDFEPEEDRPTREELLEEELRAEREARAEIEKANNKNESPGLLKKLFKLITDNAGLVITLLALVVAASGFTFAAKRKQRSISKYINQIDDTYSEYKMKAKRCEAELYRLRDIVDDELKNGKLDDSAYGLLMQRIENYMVDIQKQIVNEKFGGLPASMKDEMFKMMEDGEITEKEFEAMQTLIKRSELSSSDQDSLLQTIKEFKHQDEMLKKKKK
ncbi:hypothetical protein ACFL3C_02930 [Patescibacteria group bacterium]